MGGPEVGFLGSVLIFSEVDHYPNFILPKHFDALLSQFIDKQV